MKTGGSVTPRIVVRCFFPAICNLKGKTHLESHHLTVTIRETPGELKFLSKKLNVKETRRKHRGLFIGDKEGFSKLKAVDGITKEKIN